MRERAALLVGVYLVLLGSASSTMRLSPLSPVVHLVAIVCTFLVVGALDDVDILEQ